MPRRLHYFIVATFIAVATLTSSVRSQSITISLPTMTLNQSKVGSTVTVPVRTSSINGLNITGYNFNLFYYKTVLEYVGYTTDGTLSSALSGFAKNDTANGRVGWAAAGANPMSGGDTLIILQFKIKAVGSSLLQFKPFNEVSAFALNDVIIPTVNTGLIKVGNVAPVLQAFAAINATEKDTVRFTAIGTDADTDSLTYTITGAPVGASINAKTGVFTWVTQYGSKGTYTISVKVTDPAGASDTKTVTITIAKKNVKPTIAIIAAKTINERDTLRFTIAASDSNNDALVYSLKPLPLSATFDTLSGVFFWVPDTGSSGIYAMTAVVRDVDHATDTAKFTITVVKKDFKPQIQKITARSVVEGDSVNFTIVGTDAYNEKITYSATGMPAGSKLDSLTGAFTWKPAIGTAGKYAILFKASDPGGQFDTTTAVITVTSKFSKPVFLRTLTDTTIAENQALAFTYAAADANADALTYGLTGTIPAGATINASTGVFAWTPTYAQSGVYTFTVKATDPGGLYDSVQAKITVTDVNRKPVAGVKAPTQKIDSVTAGVLINFKATATDPDGDVVTYTWKVNGAVMKTGMDSLYTISFPTIGTTQTVMCIYSDPKGLSDSVSWSFRIVGKSTGVQRDEWTGVPGTFTVGQNYPNPFNPSTTIKFGLPKAGVVSLEIYDIVGTRVRMLLSGKMMDAAYHQVDWDGRSDAGVQVSSGMYLYRVTFDNHAWTMKMLLMR